MADSSPKLELPKPKGSRRGSTVGSAGGTERAAGEVNRENSTPAKIESPAVPSAANSRPEVTQQNSTQQNTQPDITQLVLDHHEILYRYAYRLTGSVPDAEDLTQQTFLVAHEKLGQVRQADSVRGWLFTVLRNGYLKNCRRTVPLAAASMGFDLDTVAAKADDRPLDDLPIDGEQLGRVLVELADEFKLVLLMFYFEQRSYREIAEILQVPIGTVMSRLSRAKTHLRTKLFSGNNDTHSVCGKETIHA